MNNLTVVRDVALAYFALGTVVCLVHPKIARAFIADLKHTELGLAGLLVKPILGLLIFLLACAVWPLAWFNIGKSEKRAKRAKEARDAKLEGIKPFLMPHAAMNAPASYAGGMIKFEHNGKQHTVELCDDSGFWTVFAVDGIKTSVHIDFPAGQRA
jgi:hypothetical protein